MNKNGRKSIGVFAARCEREYQRNILEGIYKSAFLHDYNVAVFGATVSGGVGFKHSGELSVFSIPNYDELAGIIYLPDTFDYLRINDFVTTPILSAVSEGKLPAITIDYKIDQLSCFYSDDSNAIKAMVDHLVIDHNCKDIAFMTGKKEHPHAQKRLTTFMDAMKEHGITITTDRFYYGDFWCNEGDNFIDFLKNNHKPMPQAIMCANEYMARSVYDSLKRRGYSIPDDILLASYVDNNKYATYISSVSCRFDTTGYEACNALIDTIEHNTTLPSTTITNSGYIMMPSITCGCKKCNDYNFSNTYNIEIDSNGSYFSQFNMMEHDLMNKTEYEDLFLTLDKYTSFIKNVRGIYFCMCENWDKPDINLSNSSSSTLSDRLQLYYYHRRNDDGTIERVIGSDKLFHRSEMFPWMNNNAKPSSYIFRSLHFFNRCLGYVVIDNGDVMQTHDDVYNYWLKDVANSIEALRRLKNIKYLSYSDLMTGIFNRNGFNNISPGLIEEARKDNHQIILAVCDLNGLKYINDTYGHNEGDYIIKTAAKFISEISVDGSITEHNFRIGGDEFVKIAIGTFNTSSESNFIKDVRNRCFEYNSISSNKSPLYISVGISHKHCNDNISIDSMVSEADIKMYEDKQELKALTGFEPKRKNN